MSDMSLPDVIEDNIRLQMPHILEILLLDRTTSTVRIAQKMLNLITR